MSVCMRESGSRSLLIVDEFGKGTARADGLALLAACLNTLLFREQCCPHVLISTHYLNISEYVANSPRLRFLVRLLYFSNHTVILCNEGLHYGLNSAVSSSQLNINHILVCIQRLLLCYTPLSPVFSSNHPIIFNSSAVVVYRWLYTHSFVFPWDAFASILSNSNKL